MRPYRIRSSWVPPEKLGDLDLIYLAWGRRRHGGTSASHIQGPWKNSGWNYAFLLSGTAHIVSIDEEKIRVLPGEVLIIPPKTEVILPRQKQADWKMVNWIWRTPPADFFPGSFWKKLRLDQATLRRVVALHAETRGEIARPDALLPSALRLIHSRLDLLLSRSQTSVQSLSRSRYELAESYVLQHPAIHDPSAALSDYLQISASTIKRLFLKHGQMSARELAYENRMQAARNLLKLGRLSIKHIAFDLGYKYPADFTRAYRSFFKVSPSMHRNEVPS